MEPPLLLCKHVFSTENKQKLTFFDTSLPLHTSAYVIYEWSQGSIEPALQVPGKETIAPCHTYRTYITQTLCPSLICYLGKKSVSGIVKHCTESAPHSAVQCSGVCLEIVIFDYQLESYCIGLLQQRKYMTGLQYCVLK